MKHYIAMSGLAGGYLPDDCQVFKTRKEAIEYLSSSIEETTKKDIAALKIDGIFYFNNGRDYAEIQECSCADMRVHSDDEIE